MDKVASITMVYTLSNLELDVASCLNPETQEMLITFGFEIRCTLFLRCST